MLPANTPTAHSFLGTFYGTWLLWKLYRIMQVTIDKNMYTTANLDSKVEYGVG